MREEKDRSGRVTRRSSTGIHRASSERVKREQIRNFDDVEKLYADEEPRRTESNEISRREQETRREDSRRDDARRDEQRRKSDAPRKSGGSGQKRARMGGDSERFVHQIVPYVMFWVALFAAVSFILRDLVGLDGSTGAFGNWFADFLCGLLGPIAYLLPLFLVVISLRWKKFVTTGILAKKLLLAGSFLLLLSGIVHVFMETGGTRGYLDAEGVLLYQNGVTRSGGGFFGGFVGEWLGYVLRLPGTILLAIPLLIIIGIYLVGLTPSALWQRISAKFKMMAEQRRERDNMRYDGKEKRPERGQRRVSEANGSQEQLSAGAQRETTNQRPRYAFREEEDEIVPRSKRARVERWENDDRDRVHSASDIVDIPDDEMDMSEPAKDTRVTFESMEHTEESVDKLDQILKEMAAGTYGQKAVPEVEKVAEEKPLQGSYYAPFALPVRPEPKHERADTTAGHIVITPQEEERSEEMPLRGTTTVGPLGSLGAKVEFAPSAKQEETLGNMGTVPPVREAARTPSSFIEEESKPPVSNGYPHSFGAAVREEEPAPAVTFAPREEPVASVREPLSDFGMSFAREEEALPKDPEREEKTVSFERVRLEDDFAFAATEPQEAASDFIGAAFANGEEEKTIGSASVQSEPVKGMRTAFSLPGEEPTREEAPTRSVAEEPLTRPVRPAPTVTAHTEIVKDDPAPVAPEPPPAPREYRFPPLLLLNEDKSIKDEDHSEEDQQKINILRQTLESFNVHIKDEVICSRGPTITRYEVRPEIGVPVRSIINRIDDISLYMEAQVRIAPIQGKAAVGVEVPNKVRETVYLRTLLESEAFKNSKKPIEVALGVGIGGDIQMCDLTAMPHLLVAGATKSGKSVCINTIILSLLYKTSPKDLRLILIDPKRVEFKPYMHLPHLYAPIITEPPRAVGALACAVQEMERRYTLLEDVGARNFETYNEKVKNDPEREHLPYLVIIIDEYYDLKMACPNNDLENYACRLAQKARAAGIHLIIGTQRPSVNVITGTLKANIPSRIAFTVMQQVDSRTILDAVGAELLTGRGDMLYAPMGEKPIRLQGSFVSDDEVENVLDYVRDHNDPVQYNQVFMEQVEMEMARAASNGKKNEDFDEFSDDNEGDEDPKFFEAVELAVQTQKVATSLLQRRLGVGYGRAAKIIDRMEELGLVTPAEGNKPRKLLPTAQGYLDHMSHVDDSDMEGDDFGEAYDQ